MKTLDEQIEYMRLRVSWYDTEEGKDRLAWSPSKGGKDLEMCQAILDTLLQLRGLKGNDNVE